jgi:hypothetical protein
MEKFSDGFYTEPDLLTDAAVRSFIRKLLHNAPAGEEGASEQMTLSLGRKVTKYMLRQWTAPSRQAARFPLAYVDALCKAVGDDTLRLVTLTRKQAEFLELGKIAFEVLSTAARERLLRKSRNAVRGSNGHRGGAQRGPNARMKMPGSSNGRTAAA